jgi:hypothetical protein
MPRSHESDILKKVEDYYGRVLQKSSDSSPVAQRDQPKRPRTVLPAANERAFLHFESQTRRSHDGIK